MKNAKYLITDTLLGRDGKVEEFGMNSEKGYGSCSARGCDCGGFKPTGRGTNYCVFAITIGICTGSQ